MEVSKMCRICLIKDVRMYDLDSYPLNTYFDLVSGNNLLDIINMPPYACYECAELLKKFYSFKQKCIRSQDILFGLLDHTGKIVSSDLNLIDRNCFLLNSNLTICHISEDTIKNIVHTESTIKDEPGNSSLKHNFMVDIGCVKDEDDYDQFSPKRVESSDDDEPLSLHKEKKVKEGDEIQVQDDNQKEQELPVIMESDEVSCNVLPIKRGRGRPKKLKPKKIRRETKADRGALINDSSVLDFEDYITVTNLSLEEQIEEINKRKESSNYLNSPYQCNLCYKGFIDTDAWKHHVGKHSPSAGDIECQICKFRFKTKRALQKHSSIHERKYACRSCPYISSNTTQAKQHQGWHKGVTYKCKFCDDIFTIWTSYMSHVRIKHPSEFICGICGYSFISKLGLAMHKTMMHKDVMEKGEQFNEDGPYCDKCDVKFISTEAFKRHMIMSTKHTRNTKTINGCRTCGDTFKNAEELRIHHRKEHARKRPKNYGKKPIKGNFPAKCEHCSEIIPNGRDHWSHYRRAHPDKQYPIQKDYVCDICGKGFRGNAFLVYHKRTHSGERTYKCGQCGKAFFNRTNLQVHEKTHSESRPYPCSVCLKAFKCKGALNRHFRSHTGQKPYECEVCGKAFTQSNSRKLHVNTVHLKQPAPYISRKRNKNIDKETTSQTFIY